MSPYNINPRTHHGSISHVVPIYLGVVTSILLLLLAINIIEHPPYQQSAYYLKHIVPRSDTNVTILLNEIFTSPSKAYLGPMGIAGYIIRVIRLIIKVKTGAEYWNICIPFSPGLFGCIVNCIIEFGLVVFTLRAVTLNGEWSTATGYAALNAMVFGGVEMLFMAFSDRGVGNEFIRVLYIISGGLTIIIGFLSGEIGLGMVVKAFIGLKISGIKIGGLKLGVFRILWVVCAGLAMIVAVIMFPFVPIVLAVVGAKSIGYWYPPTETRGDKILMAVHLLIMWGVPGMVGDAAAVICGAIADRWKSHFTSSKKSRGLPSDEEASDARNDIILCEVNGRLDLTTRI
jgi:hypothetical protein